MHRAPDSVPANLAIMKGELKMSKSKAFAKIKWVIITILLLLVVFVVAVFVYAGQATKVVVEKAGTQALGVRTELEKANLSFLGGALKLNGLAVGNPEGYQTEHLLTIGTCSTAVEIGSLLSDTINVSTIEIDSIVLTIEQKGLKSNLGEILDRISQMKGEEPTEPKEPADGEAPGKQVAIQKIQITNAAVELKLLPLPGQASAVPIKLAPITLENVSSEGNKGELLVTVFRKVLVALSQAVLESGAALPGDIKSTLTSAVANLDQALGGVLSGMTGGAAEMLAEPAKVIEDLGGELGKTAEDIGKGAEDLLKAPGQLFEPKEQEEP